MGFSQPRISSLIRGKIGLFTIDTLVNMVTSAGLKGRGRHHVGQAEGQEQKSRLIRAGQRRPSEESASAD